MRQRPFMMLPVPSLNRAPLAQTHRIILHHIQSIYCFKLPAASACSSVNPPVPLNTLPVKHISSCTTHVQLDCSDNDRGIYMKGA